MGHVCICFVFWVLRQEIALLSVNVYRVSSRQNGMMSRGSGLTRTGSFLEHLLQSFVAVLVLFESDDIFILRLFIHES